VRRANADEAPDTVAGGEAPGGMTSCVYQAYGLNIDSPVPLDLPTGASAADVVVRMERLPHVGAPLAWEKGSAFAGGEARELALRVPGLLAAEVRDGERIAIDPDAGADPVTLGAFVLQPLLGYALLQRGLLVLHASCVLARGRAVAFVGFAGAGKSTTAGALLRRGHALLCDDVLAIRRDGTTLPGVTGLKLWPEAAAALGQEPATLERLMPGTEKRLRHVAGSPEAGTVPLHIVYVLEEGPAGITPLSPATALAELVRHSYGILAIRHTGQQAEHFGRLTTLLGQVRVKRLARPASLAGLDALARAIEEDVVAGDEPAATHGPAAGPATADPPRWVPRWQSTTTAVGSTSGNIPR
jgi:hypothetical protein